MEVLSSRMLIRPIDGARSRRFYGETLGLAVYREYGDPADPGVVYFLGNGLLEVTGTSGGPTDATALWVQVRDVHAEYARLVQAGVDALAAPQTKPWGLIEALIADPDGHRIILVEVPVLHPLRRDQRGLALGRSAQQPAL